MMKHLSIRFRVDLFLLRSTASAPVSHQVFARFRLEFVSSVDQSARIDVNDHNSQLCFTR